MPSVFYKMNMLLSQPHSTSQILALSSISQTHSYTHSFYNDNHKRHHQQCFQKRHKTRSPNSPAQRGAKFKNPLTLDPSALEKEVKGFERRVKKLRKEVSTWDYKTWAPRVTAQDVEYLERNISTLEREFKKLKREQPVLSNGGGPDEQNRRMVAKTEGHEAESSAPDEKLLEQRVSALWDKVCGLERILDHSWEIFG